MKYTSFKNYPETYVFESTKPGKTLLVFWWVHGNERAWIEAIEKVKTEIISQEIKLTSGTLILALGNLDAIESNSRDGIYNMNRMFHKKYIESNSDESEILRIRQLADIMRHADVLIDIHSVSSTSTPFVFAENIPKEKELADYITPGNTIFWWEENGGDILSWDTNSYMHSLWKIAITLEAGNHYDTWSSQIAYINILKTLEYYNMLNNTDSESTRRSERKNIYMYKVYQTISWKFEFESGIENFWIISSWQKIGNGSGVEVYADENFIILLPNFGRTKPGDEVFYYGKEISHYKDR